MLAFLWKSTRGYRLAPWNSPYLRWRIETYWGWHASQITPAQFRAFVWQHRKELRRFLRWAAQMHSSSLS